MCFAFPYASYPHPHMMILSNMIDWALETGMIMFDSFALIIVNWNPPLVVGDSLPL